MLSSESTCQSILPEHKVLNVRRNEGYDIALQTPGKGAACCAQHMTHLVTSQVPMDDRRILQVQVVEPGQDLSRPLPDRLELQVSVLLPVLSQIARREELRDEVDAVMLVVMPTPAEAQAFQI